MVAIAITLLRVLIALLPHERRRRALALGGFERLRVQGFVRL